ncbi:6-phosphofructokinase [Dehalobacterium formicoaceticum]|uniref:ATP-dependent 6-phosphofructokinase n=1 Tax=Dehalobacterium formicoaceticum TaxID=51515 RepID=A0ABT1Y3T1_9FIRM|nr:ATP-dependent 6-phosphofructokinase [Dehalobacterium formicoaceticum]MCR6545527.1 6-phosphofructokinase [Dehalobacterium formicoaceticum]
MRIGVLTGGGDCPGLNAVIRAVVKTAIRDYGMEVWGIKNGYSGLVEDEIIPLGMESVVGILPRGGTILGTTNRDSPFRYQVVTNGQVAYVDKSKQAMEVIRKRGLDALIIIGGDGSLNIAQKFYDLGINVIGVPKTIDNDISGTDMTFGFDTAMATATEAIDKLHTTAESHHRIMILEVMGRDAGWIAIHSGIAGGADVILIPEIPFTFEKISAKIQERVARGRNFSIVVVAEGAAPMGGGQVTAGVNEGNIFNPVKLGGIGQYVQEKITTCTGQETRVTVLGHLQRGGSPTPFDRLLATRYGSAAVHALARGEQDVMTSLHGQDVITIPLMEGIKQQKQVPPQGELVRTAKALGISFGD